MTGATLSSRYELAVYVHTGTSSGDGGDGLSDWVIGLGGALALIGVLLVIALYLVKRDKKTDGEELDTRSQAARSRER
ncbi:hypothetical protein AAFP35_24495 [Gordonia sp. CPCC 206044]|uniref:hypothetical protein n=1 Tax=Gordonia sp. CPCC 206044 TaxID=3140793 RepID=UPI003AF3F9AF